MASTYVNDLRLNEMATGDQSGSWGTVTNTNLELIAEAFSFGTEGITTNADTHTTTIADGATDPGRSMFLKYTGTLDSACTITIAPNTISKLWFIENGTSGSQNIIIKQGSGATITIPPGDTKAIYSDGAGSGAAMVDAFASLNVVDLKVQDDLTVTDDVAIGGLATVGGTLGVTGIATFTDDIIIGDGKTIGSASTVGAITIASDGDTTFSADVNVGANFDVTGNAVIDGTALVTGVLTTTAATVFNGGFAANEISTITDATSLSAGLTIINTADVHGSVIDFFNNSSSPEDGDYIGGLKFKETNSAGGTHIYSKIFGIATDVTDGTEDGAITFETSAAGANTAEIMRITNSSVDIGLSSGASSLRIQSSGNKGLVLRQNTTVDRFKLFVGDGSPNTADENFISSNNTNLNFLAGGSGTTEAMQLTTLGGLILTPANGGHAVFNESDGNVDFRVESLNNTHMLYVDGGNNRVSIGSSTIETRLGQQLALTSSGGTDRGGISINAYGPASASGPIFDFNVSRATSPGSHTVVVNGDALGTFIFRGDDGDEFQDGAAIEAAVDTTPGNNNMPSRLVFYTRANNGSMAEKMRINNAGAVLIGGTNTNPAENDATGVAISADGRYFGCANQNEVMRLNRKGNNGDVLIFHGGGTVAGHIGVDTDLYLGSKSSARYFIYDSAIAAGNDNQRDLGISNYRWNDAFVTNGVTTGSDRTEKQDIAVLTSAEMLVAARISQTFHTYRWKDAVVDKGDNARIHTGTIAQEVQAAFTAEGLDAGRYAIFMSDTWWEHDVDVAAVEADDTVDPAIEAADAYTRTDNYKTEDEAPSGSTSRTRLGIRYHELLSFLAAYNEQRFAAIETRLTALEG